MSKLTAAQNDIVRTAVYRFCSSGKNFTAHYGEKVNQKSLDAVISAGYLEKAQAWREYTLTPEGWNYATEKFGLVWFEALMAAFVKHQRERAALNRNQELAAKFADIDGDYEVSYAHSQSAYPNAYLNFSGIRIEYSTMRKAYELDIPRMRTIMANELIEELQLAQRLIARLNEIHPK